MYVLVYDHKALSLQEFCDSHNNDIVCRDEPTQMAALKIVQGMVQHRTLSLEQTAVLLPLVKAFGSHPSQPCRLVMYDTLIALYNGYR